MGDTVTNSTPQPTDTDDTTVEPQGDASSESTPVEEVVDWKAMARKWEERAKASYKDTAELKKLREAHGELEARTRELQSQVDAFTLEKQTSQWKRKVSEELGVPASVLRGSTLEEIREHGESIAAAFTQTRKPLAPVVDDQGKQPSGKAVTASGMRGLAQILFNPATN